MNAPLLTNSREKTKRVEDNTTHSYKEQFPIKPTTGIETTNTTQGLSTKKTNDNHKT
jgi:hypothetical protein